MINIFFNATENRIRSFWRIILQFILLILCLGIVSIPNYSSGGDTLRYTMNGLAMLFSVYVAARLFDKRPFADFGLATSRIWWMEYGYGVISGFLAMLFIFLVLLAFDWISITGYGWERAAPEKFAPSLLAYLWVMFWVGFYEEVFSRGYHLKNMTEGFTTDANRDSWWPALLAILTSSVIFSLLHRFNPGFNYMSLTGIILAGIVLALPYLFTGRLAYSIGLHFSWNFFQGGLFGFNVSGNPFRYSIIQIKPTGPEWITGGGFGPEAGLIGFYALLGLLYGIFIWYKRSGAESLLHPSFNYPPDSIQDT